MKRSLIVGVDWEFIVRSGDPAHALMVMADDRSAAAIVVGGRPHRAAVSVPIQQTHHASTAATSTV